MKESVILCDGCNSLITASDDVPEKKSTVFNLSVDKREGKQGKEYYTGLPDDDMDLDLCGPCGGKVLASIKKTLKEIRAN